MKKKKEIKSAGGGAYFASVPGNWQAREHEHTLSEAFNNLNDEQHTTAHMHRTVHSQNDGVDSARSGELVGLELSITLLTATTQPPSHPATYYVRD